MDDGWTGKLWSMVLVIQPDFFLPEFSAAAMFTTSNGNPQEKMDVMYQFFR